MNLVVVICHYKENLDWVKKLNHNYVIYNKNPNENHLYKNNLPNIGFDTIVYLSYILDNYENLPEYVCFSQDNPFDHCPNFLDKVNNFDYNRNFYPLGATYIRDNEMTYNQTINYAKSVDIVHSETIKFVSSAQCIVSKELILKRSKGSYLKIKNSIPEQVITNTNYLIEYLWPTILNFNDDLDLSLYNC